LKASIKPEYKKVSAYGERLVGIRITITCDETTKDWEKLRLLLLKLERTKDLAIISPSVPVSIYRPSAIAIKIDNISFKS